MDPFDSEVAICEVLARSLSKRSPARRHLTIGDHDRIRAQGDVTNVRTRGGEGAGGVTILSESEQMAQTMPET